MDTVDDAKNAIASKLLIPRDQLVLRIAGKRNHVMIDAYRLYEYNKWSLNELDMVLKITGSSGKFCVRVCSDLSYGVENIILKVNSFDTIETVKNQIYIKRGMPPRYQLLVHSQSLELHLAQLSKLRIIQPYQKGSRDNLWSLEQETVLKCSDKYIELSDCTWTLGDYNVSLFQHLLQLRVCLLHIEYDGVHVYSIQTSNDSDTSHHNPNDYFLSVEYDTRVYKLYSMIADHYKTFADHIVLLTNGYQIVCGAAALHVLFYPPIIHKHKHAVLIGGRRSDLFSHFGKCHNPTHCELGKKVNNDPIVKEMVNIRNDAWKVIIKVFNISDKIRQEIEENSEDNHVRCIDVMHYMYHHDDELTWEFVEMQVRREHQQLADVIRTHL